MRIHLLKWVPISLIFTFLLVTPTHAQLNTTFERMFSKLLREDLISVGPFRGGFDEAADLANSVLVPAFNTLVGSNVSNFPLTSTVAGIKIDLSAGVPKLTVASSGPIFSETAESIGRGKLYVALNYSYYNLTKFRGLDTDDIRFTFTHSDVTRDGTLGDNVLENETIDFFPNLDIQAYTFVFYATYGLTSNFDIGFAVPLVRLSLSGEARAVINTFSFLQLGQAINNYNDDALNPQLTNTFRYDESKTGLGDIALRLKYSFRQESQLDLAAFAEVRLPTGDEKNFFGTGKTNARFSIIASKKINDFTPHLNVGYKLRGADFESDRLEFAVGFDQKLAKGLTFVMDLLGEYDLESGKTIQLLPGTTTIINQSNIPAPGRAEREVDLSNIRETDRDNLFNSSIGFKLAPSEKFTFLANILVPMNDGGLRARISPTIGLSLIF